MENPRYAGAVHAFEAIQRKEILLKICQFSLALESQLKTDGIHSSIKR